MPARDTLHVYPALWGCGMPFTFVGSRVCLFFALHARFNYKLVKGFCIRTFVLHALFWDIVIHISHLASYDHGVSLLDIWVCFSGAHDTAIIVSIRFDYCYPSFLLYSHSLWHSLPHLLTPSNKASIWVSELPCPSLPKLLGLFLTSSPLVTQRPHSPYATHTASRNLGANHTVRTQCSRREL
jgi:hypothetical protein